MSVSAGESRVSDTDGIAGGNPTHPLAAPRSAPRRFVWLLAAALAAATFATPAPASAATPCPSSSVTDAEWDRLEYGMRAIQVFSIIGGTGRLAPNPNNDYEVIRDFSYCGERDWSRPGVRIRFIQVAGGYWVVNDLEVL